MISLKMDTRKSDNDQDEFPVSYTPEQIHNGKYVDEDYS